MLELKWWKLNLLFIPPTPKMHKMHNNCSVVHCSNYNGTPQAPHLQTPPSEADYAKFSQGNGSSLQH